ncbi:MAG: carbohydrate binding family 9 domain-containing protein [Acidobacteria bacterium]|nr:carbohydrate binding family 9 domain-containing protein [Acidobacteriota bacterium]
MARTNLRSPAIDLHRRKYGIRPFCRVVFAAFIFLAANIASLLPALAADLPEVRVKEASGRIQIDGILDDPEWGRQPDAIELTQVEPRPGEPPSEATRVWLAFNRDSLYIAVRCHDRHPGRIVATSMQRDADLMNNDNIEIVLDTYNDDRNAYYFATNAAGALVDGRITENQGAALEWDGIWNVRTQIDDSGWTAEFDIPFKTIGFGPGLIQWGFNISRYLARGRETSRWASPSLDVRLSHINQAGHILGIENPSQGMGLDIKPYGIMGVRRDITRQDVVQFDPDAGADIFYRVTANLVSSTTFNTDFAETEVDTRQVNLTRFKLFYPEKRSFFLEDAGIFEFAKIPAYGPPDLMMGGDLLPFFSRRIGLVGDDEIPIRVGQKLTGKIGKFDVGVLDVQTGRFDEPEGPGRPALHVASKNLAVGRVKANFLSQSYVGAIFTNGDPTGETSNQLGGVDLKLATSNFLNRRKNISLMLFGSKTRTTGLQNKDAAYGGNLSYPNDLLKLNYKWMKIEQNYNAALGFTPRTGVRISSVYAEIAPRPHFWDIRQMNFEFGYDDYFKLDRGDWESRRGHINPFRLQFNSGDFVGYEWRWENEQLFEPWLINPNEGITLPPGKYKFNTHNFFLKSSESRTFSIQSHFATGSFYSGTIRGLESDFVWRQSSHLTASLMWAQNWIRLKEGDFNTSLVIGRLDYSFTPFITLANFAQYDTDSRDIGLQSRLRWILKPGNEFFVVFNHNWQENEMDRFESAQTRFQVKLNYVFRF